MKIRFITISVIFLLIFFGAGTIHVRAEGTKQLKPDTTYYCDLYIQPGSSGFSCFATQTCNDDQKLFVRVGNASEKIYLGFGNNLTFRIKRNGIVVFGPVTVTVNSIGYIKYYSQAIFGPNVLGPPGYNALVFYPGSAADYSIEFDQTSVGKFDISVIDTAIFPLAQINGRLWSKDWGFNTGTISVPKDAFLATQYIYSDDSVVTSIYYNQMRGHLFDVTSTSNGCYPPPMPFDSSCRSRPGNHHYAQYKIFLCNPDSLQFPTGTLGNIINGNVNVVQQCDGSFTFSFWVNKPGRVEIDIEVNPAPGHQQEDVSIIDTVYAGWNSIVWNGLDGNGNPVPDGNMVSFSITYINGLTNLALYDVERHPLGFIIQLIRPAGPPIASYWNDTLLRAKGGTVQLTGCYGSYPTTGCHTWTGDYGGIGLGSENSVNTWWYAASSAATIGNYIMTYGPTTPTDITGPTLFCQSSAASYTIVPNPLPGADANMYEWVLTDVSSGLPLFDLTSQGTSITINFSLYPAGDKRLKVRGYKAACGYGPFGPGLNGIGILISNTVATQITNTTVTFSLCSGDMTNIFLQTSLSPATFSYTASATSPLLSGYSANTLNPIQQTLTSTGLTPDSVIYRVVPYVSPCYGDTANFYVIVNPIPQVTNTTTNFTQCSEATTNIVLQSNIPTASFFWTASGSSPDVTGYSADVGPVISQTLVNSGASPQTVTYTVGDSIYGCTGLPKLFTVTVNPKVPVSITISPSANPFCLNTAVIFTALAVNGGTLPAYQWKVNGGSAGSNLPTYSYIPTDGDIVSCILTSNIPCPLSNPVTSNNIVMVLNTNFPAGVSISPSENPFCSGTSVTFTAVPFNGGTTPSYQWKVNGGNTGPNSATFSYIPMAGDNVQCTMSSNLPCVTGSPVTSNSISMTFLPNPVVSFTACFDTITRIDARPIKLKGGIPLGGTYSGPGVNSITGIFTPSLAGVGTKTITYSYTNAALCTASKSISIVNYQVSIFNCGSILTDIRDNKTYATIQIGSQCWMAANLNFGAMIAASTHQRDNCIPEKYCYNDLTADCGLRTYYQWDELMQYDDTPGNQGFCPPGWHIPDETEWQTLFSFYINNGFAASPLKYSGYSGFNALLEGSGHSNRTWDYPGFATFYWSSTSHGPDKAWVHGMNDPDPSVSYYPALRTNAFSIRCLKD